LPRKSLEQHANALDGVVQLFIRQNVKFTALVVLPPLLEEWSVRLKVGVDSFVCTVNLVTNYFFVLLIHLVIDQPLITIQMQLLRGQELPHVTNSIIPLLQDCLVLI
jgi:hypothetical protein